MSIPDAHSLSSNSKVKNSSPCERCRRLHQKVRASLLTCDSTRILTFDLRTWLFQCDGGYPCKNCQRAKYQQRAEICLPSTRRSRFDLENNFSANKLDGVPTLQIVIEDPSQPKAQHRVFLRDDAPASPTGVEGAGASVDASSSQEQSPSISLFPAATPIAVHRQAATSSADHDQVLTALMEYDIDAIFGGTVADVNTWSWEHLLNN